MAGGRPTKYTPELLAKAHAYVDGGWVDEGDLIPSHAGLAVTIEVTRTTLYDWESDPDKVEFSNILAKCNITQERKLLNGGLGGEFNPAITKLALGKQGYSDKLDQVSDINVNVSEYSDAQLDAVISQNS
jgi:hypothetical protein